MKRSSNCGSDRYNERILPISRVELQKDGKSVKLFLRDINPVDVMTISYDILDANQIPFEGTVQNTIHNLKAENSL